MFERFLRWLGILPPEQRLFWSREPYEVGSLIEDVMGNYYRVTRFEDEWVYGVPA